MKCPLIRGIISFSRTICCDVIGYYYECKFIYLISSGTSAPGSSDAPKDPNDDDDDGDDGDDDNKGGLSGGAIAGIVIGVIAAIIVEGIILYKYYNYRCDRRRANNNQDVDEQEVGRDNL